MTQFVEIVVFDVIWLRFDVRAATTLAVIVLHFRDFVTRLALGVKFPSGPHFRDYLFDPPSTINPCGIGTRAHADYVRMMKVMPLARDCAVFGADDSVFRHCDKGAANRRSATCSLRRMRRAHPNRPRRVAATASRKCNSKLFVAQAKKCIINAIRLSMTNPSTVNFTKFAAKIRTKRGSRGLREAAIEIGQISASTLSRIEQGNVPDLETFMRICQWLGVSADEFRVDVALGMDPTPQDPEEIIEVHLRADKTLPPEAVDALSQMIRFAYKAAKAGNFRSKEA